MSVFAEFIYEFSIDYRVVVYVSVWRFGVKEIFVWMSCELWELRIDCIGRDFWCCWLVSPFMAGGGEIYVCLPGERENFGK